MKPRIPAIAEPDQRYWRRRANRRVRKERLARSLGRWSFVVGAHGLILSGLLFAGARVGIWAVRSDVFRVERIELEGVQRGSTDALLQRLSPLLHRNVFDVPLDAVRAEVLQDDWVRACSVRRVLPGTLRVRVEERVPAAVAVLDSRAWLIDRTGWVIGPARGADADLPVLNGLETRDREARIAGLRRGVELLERLRAESPEFAASLSELDLSRRDRVVARTVLPGPDYLLDPDRVERNVNTFIAMQQEFERRVGAADAVDLRWADRIAFRTAGEGKVH